MNPGQPAVSPKKTVTLGVRAGAALCVALVAFAASSAAQAALQRNKAFPAAATVGDGAFHQIDATSVGTIVQLAPADAVPTAPRTTRTAENGTPHDDGGTSSGHDLMDKIQDWMARANREYQKTIIPRLSTPSPDADAVARKREQVKEEEAKAKAKAAEAARRAEEARKAEAARKAAEEAKQAEAARKAAEEARQAEAARKAAEEAKQAEAARKAAEEAKQAEAARKAAEEAKQAEAARKAAEEAKQAEGARKAAEEARQAEAARKAAEEAKQADEARKIAAQPPPTSPAGREGEVAAPPPQPIPEPGSMQAQKLPGGILRPEPALESDSDLKETEPPQSAETNQISRRSEKKGSVRHWVRRERSCRMAGRHFREPGHYTVRRGDSLWRISRYYYRRGWFYHRLYRANRRIIRDPDLIYPCQRIFVPRRR